MKADIIADVYLYPTDQGGKRFPIQPGYGCPCLPDKDVLIGWDFRLVSDRPLMPGEMRRVGLALLSGQEAAAVLCAAGQFYLWEGRIIGEATVVNPTENSN
jgi:hypothetical protein